MKKRILVIAGSDSSGGAGLEADQKVIAAHGAYAMTATTALTAQNTLGVYDIHYIPPGFVRQQIDACINDIGVDVIKTGMLASAETVTAVADAILSHGVENTIVDPVMVSTSGTELLPRAAVKTFIAHMLPVTRILTPNVPEAILILQEAGVEVNGPENWDDLETMANQLRTLGPKYVLLKGGHIPFTKDGKLAKFEDEKYCIMNAFAQPEGTVCIKNLYLKSKNNHGTGCSLASAIASNLANGMDILPAVKSANVYVVAGIKASRNLGQGSGPINHFHSTYTLPFPPDQFVEYILERRDVQPVWRQHVYHEFVQQMAVGTLPVEKFKKYLIQDYLFLIQFARANALASYKSSNMKDINRSAEIVLHIQRETKLHIDYCCNDYGLSLEEITAQPEHQACTAYTRYVLDIGMQQDFLALQIALLPCLLGYGAIARRLYDDPETKRSENRYFQWICTYVSEDYVEAVDLGRSLIEKEAAKASVSRIEELVQIFIHATKMETGFWDMGMED